MNNQETQKLRNLLSQRQWGPAIELLRKTDPTSAADFFLSEPYDEQRALFHAMPVDMAASLIVHLPYYHAYVLLHSLPSQDMRAVIEAMTAGERNHFLDALESFSRRAAGRSVAVLDGRAGGSRHGSAVLRGN